MESNFDVHDPWLQALKDTFLALAPIPPAEWEVFSRELELRPLREGGLFLERGKPCHEVAFVAQGLFKSSYLTRHGVQFIRNFSSQGNFLAAMVPLLRGESTSDVTVTALEDSELVVSSWDNFCAGYRRHWSWQQLGRRLSEINYLAREERQYQLLALSAEERFEAFLERYPQLLGRLREKDIAAYLGVKPESLSRLRARRWRRSRTGS